MQQFIQSVVNAPNQFIANHHLNEYWALTIMLAELVTLYLFGLLIVTAIQDAPIFFSFLLRKCGVGKEEIPQTFLELIFPADTTKSAFATEQLHILLRSSVGYRSRWERLAGRKKPYSLEIVGTHDNGIRFVLRIPKHMTDVVRRNLLSYLPGIKVREIDDYMKDVTGKVGAIELELAGDFVLPLKDHKMLSEHDIMAYLTGHMTNLAPEETIAVQIVAAPVFSFTHRRVARRLRHFRSRIALGKEISSQLKRQRTPLARVLWFVWYPPFWFVASMGKIVAFVGKIIAIIMLDLEGSSGDKEKRRSDNPYEQELMQTVKSKVDQHLFEVTIRLLAASSEPERVHERLNALLTSFQPFTTNYQGLQVRRNNRITATGKDHLPRFRARVLSPHLLSQPTILSSSELADLYHFPNTDTTKTAGLVKSRSRELPTPLSIKKSDAQFDVVVGSNSFGSEETPIGLTLEQRQKHTYVIGKTGTGKTTLLKNKIYQDMLSGKGLAVLDPHGDMFRELLAIVPEHRKKDVIVFDPSDRQHPVGLNILAPGVAFDNNETAHEWITSMVLSVFAKLSDESFWGPRMEHILRSVTLTALATDNPNLFTLQRLLTDKKYQKTVAKTLDDPILKQFWAKEVASYGDMQFGNMVAPLTHRLGHFITTKMSRHILLQQQSTISISDIINEGKILLVNLSKGDIGEDQSLFFGTLLTSLIWMAAYQRTRIPEKKRRDFFVYVDEFQNFATQQFTDITSEGRKFHVSLIASHQNIAQISDPSVLKTVAANVGSIICLKASPDDEAFILPFMQPEVEKGDIVNLAPHKFYMKTTADDSEAAFSGNVVPLDIEPSSKVKTAVLAYSRKHYTTPRAAVEAHLKELMSNV